MHLHQCIYINQCICLLINGSVYVWLLTFQAKLSRAEPTYVPRRPVPLLFSINFLFQFLYDHYIEKWVKLI